MALSPEERESIEGLVDEMLVSYDIIENLTEDLEYKDDKTRDVGYRPTKEEDPCNAFIRKCTIKGAPRGRLLGYRVAVKDNVSVRGVPMTNASRLCEGYVPNVDATVVTRLLAEGSVIVGKTNMDDMSSLCTSESSSFGPVSNPFNPAYSPGGSSSGSAVAVATGQADLAISVDQGGSARMPAAWCGVTSIKATHGLVSTFGLSYIDLTIDHICPTARNVKDLALALEVMAGEDENDPQWIKGPIKLNKYTDHTSGSSVPNLRIGLLKESMEWPFSNGDVNDAVRKALSKMERLGAEVDDSSAPLFKFGTAIFNAALTISSTAMIESDGEGYWHEGYHNVHWNEFFGRARRAKADSFAAPVKLSLIVGKYMQNEYFSAHYSKAQNLRRALRTEIDKQLEVFDVLALPTIPMNPIKLKANLGFKEMAIRDANIFNNCCPFNLTGHPAISIPCSMVNDFPVGLQLVAKHFDEATLFKVASAFENSFDWRR